MAISPLPRNPSFEGSGPFTPGYGGTSANRIQIGFDPKSINEVISGCWGMTAYAGVTAWRYSREVALETYRGIVQHHPRDTRFSVRQIQVNYTISDVVSTRGEQYDYRMSKWICIGRGPDGLRFRLRRTDAKPDEYRLVWNGDTPKAVRYRNDPPRKKPYDDPELSQLRRVRLLDGARTRSILMPSETTEFKNWSKRKTIFVFSNARYERYLNYGGSGRPGLYYWELSFAQAAAKATAALATLGFSQSMISGQESVILDYKNIVEDLIDIGIDIMMDRGDR